jgi:hypothetical protein
MVRRLHSGAFILALVIGCRGPGEELPEPTKPAEKKPPIATCAPTHTADGPACAPTFDACGETAIAKLGGGCEPAGVTACAAGFVAEAGGCRATLPATPCEPGAIALPGMSACEAIAPCGEVAGATLFVDATGVFGDGSRAKPFARINEAIAAASPGAVIAVAAGTYDEDVTIDKAVRIVGSCPTAVTIRGVLAGEDRGAVVITASASLERVSVTGPAAGVVVTGAKGVVIDSTRVFAALNGIRIRKGADAIVRRTVVDGARQFGIVVSGAVGRVERSHVHGTKEEIVSIGVRVNPDPVSLAPGEVIVVGSLLEKNEYANAEAVSSKMTIEGSVLRDGVPVAGKYGVGVMAARNMTVKQPADLTVRGSIVEGNSYIGIVATDSKLLVEGSVIRNTKLEAKDKKYGRGIVVQGNVTAVEARVSGSVIEANQETGIDVNGDAKMVVTGSIVRDTKANGETGTGVFGEVLNGKAPALEIDRSLFTGNAKAGVISAGMLTVRASRFSHNKIFSLVTRGGAATVSASLFEDTSADANGLNGHGLLAIVDKTRILDPALTVEDTAVRRARKAGIAMFGGKLTIARSSVQDIAAEKVAGLGVSIESKRPVDSSLLEIDQSLIEKVSGAAVLVYGAPARLSNVHIRDVRLGEGVGFGDGVFVGGMFFETFGIRTASLELRGSWIERAARTGVAMFGSSLAMEGTFLTCNLIPLDVEPIAAWNGKEFLDHAFDVDDRGGNVCGCNTNEACAARSTNLKPSAPEQAPEL